MANVTPPAADDWRLGIELGERHELEPVLESPRPDRNLSRERLERPLQVVTVEHLGWLVVAAYALLTRFYALGARPLDGAEAANAVFELGLAGSGGGSAASSQVAYGGWIHVLQAGIFVVAGANDFSARLIFALGGMLLIAAAFALRRQLGRAGALALAVMLTLSPTITYFARASATASVVAALMLVTVALFIRVRERPASRHAVALGVVAGLMLAVDPLGLAAGLILLATFVVVGSWEVLARANRYLRIRVWLDQYANLAALAIMFAVATWLLSELALVGRPGIRRLYEPVIALWPGRLHPDFAGALRFYAPGLVLYEFLIMIGAAAGCVTILALRVRSRFAAWCLIWALLSLVFCAWSPRPTPQTTLIMLVPVALMAAIGADFLHHLEIWRAVRVALAALAILTLYVQVLANFVYAAPDASRAPWAQRANLYWGEHATTVQCRKQTAGVLDELAPADATVFYDTFDSPAIRWYLRALRAVPKREAATVVVSPAAAYEFNADSTIRKLQFDFEMGWNPRLDGLDARSAIRFLFTGLTWGQVSYRAVTITVRPTNAPTPTVIFTPGVSP